MKYLFFSIVLLGVFQLQSQSETSRQEHFNLASSRLAIQGYDPVSYFNSDAPIKGKSQIKLEYEGVVYHFANAQNMELFKAQPEKYEPVWGGWCGHAMAQRGGKVAINPTCYKIIDGRNVLFYKTIWANALTNWEKEIKTTPEGQLIKTGDQFWADIAKSK